MLETERTMLPQNRVNLEEDEIPTRYYNIQADLREPLPPPLDAKTKLPTEAREARYDGDVWSGGSALTQRGHEFWKILASPRQEPSRNSRHRNKRSARRHRYSRQHEILPWLGHEPRPDPSINHWP